MIKQSRNAVTMLLSCFKGIYQSAYVKGIASAVVLTAGLAAGAANADNITGAANGSEWVISSSATVDEDTGITNIPETVTTVKVTGAGVAVTVSPSSGAYDVGRDYDLVVEKGASYTVSGSASAAATENWNNITVTGGTVTIGGAGTNASVLGTTDEGEGNIILNSADTTVAKVVLDGTGSTATLGTDDKSAITLDGNAQIEIKGTHSGSVAGVSFTMEETLTTTKASATPSVSVADGAKGAISVKNFTMEGGYIRNLGTLNIGVTGGKATITGGTIENGTVADDVITFTSAVTLGKDVKVDNDNGGKIKFSENATVDASLFKDGALWKADTAVLTLTAGKTLTVESDSAVDLVSVGFVESAGTIIVADDVAATVAMDAATLNTAAFAGGNIELEIGQLTVSGNAGEFTIGGSKAGNITVLDSLSMTTKDASGDKTLKVGASGQASTLTLGESGSVADGSLNGINLVVAAGATSVINVAGGNWTGNNVTLTAGNFNVSGGSFTGDTLDVGTAAGAATIAAKASAVFDTVKVQKASGMTVKGTLTVLGDGDPLKYPSKPYDETDNPYTATVNLTTSADNSLTIADGGNVIIGDAKDVLQLKYASNAFSTGGDYKKLTNNGTLTLKGMDAVLDGVSALNKTQLNSLKGVLQKTSSTGKIDIGSVNIDFSDVKTNENGEYAYSDVSFASGFVNDQTQDMKISVTSNDNTTTGLAGNWASFNTTDSTINTFNLSGSTTLYGDEKGNLAVKHTADGDEILGFNFDEDTSLTLEGSGKIGAISATTAGSGSVTVNSNISVTDKAGEKLAAIGASGTEVKEVIVNGSLQASGINTYELTVNGGTIDMATANGTQNIVLGGATAPASKTESAINGGYVTADSLQLLAGNSTTNTNNLAIYGGSTVIVDRFTATDNTNTIRVGRDADEDAGIASSTGSFYAGTLTLNGATLEIDPEYSNQAAVVAADELSTGNTADGLYELGKNAALGIGFESLDEFRTEALSKFTNANGALNQDSIGSLIYINRPVTLDDAAGIAMNADGTPGTEVEYGAAATARNITLGANTALVLSRDAFFDGGAAKAALTADNGAGTAVSLDVNSKIILDGIFTAQDTGMTLIKEGTGQDVTLAFTDGVGKTATDGSVEVQVGNGVITAGKLDASSVTATTAEDIDLTFAIDDDRLNALNASAAAKKLVRDSFEDYSAEDIDDNAGLSFVYLAGTGYGQDGSAIDAAANLAVFGGAAQTALMASQTTTDVISARMGVGNVNSALMYADNASGAGIWLAPVYRNHDSDSFDANGVDYGADIDLTGVAFGADFTTDEGLRFGAMFNIGTGDADGQGAASAVSNDFDYYALGLYAGASFDKFSLVGDLTYAQSSNDIEMNSIIGKMDADTDVSALSFGLTGQYEFSTGVLDILPHVGVRFTQLEMDSYDVKVGGDAVAASDSDTMNIVSIPVGVTFAKEIAAGEWYVKPALDLAVTMNTGDNELDTDTSFGPMSMEPVSAEVIDDVTYSVGLGLSARYNALSLGLGVNYVGSDNTDEFGVSGMARYSF